jgi:hypothetical protein
MDLFSVKSIPDKLHGYDNAIPGSFNEYVHTGVAHDAEVAAGHRIPDFAHKDVHHKDGNKLNDNPFQGARGNRANIHLKLELL